VEVPDDVAQVPEDAQVMASGLASKVLVPGVGTTKPTGKSKVKVHYSGWTFEGRMFDSTITRGQVAEFQLSRVIPGLREGLQLMVVGEKRRFWVPAKLGYDESGGTTKAPAGALVFDIELLSFR
jgi:FKBP-type peptidyl-prolyl cis-trans isomerase